MKQFFTISLIALLFVAFNPFAASAKETVKNDTVSFTLTPPPTCQNCINKIKGNLRFEKGVKDIDVNLDTKSVSIVYSPKSTDSEKLTKALGKIGYTAAPYSAKAACKKADAGCSACPGKAEKACQGASKSCCKDKK
ncbi:MAG: heavy-metal-associated domain-containing protein [Lachnoclostridium sp.]|nr:heavy-metal-associated domain-containing protein [Lachnoclostridium sp.]